MRKFTFPDYLFFQYYKWFRASVETRAQSVSRQGVASVAQATLPKSLSCAGSALQ